MPSSPPALLPPCPLPPLPLSPVPSPNPPASTVPPPTTCSPLLTPAPPPEVISPQTLNLKPQIGIFTDAFRLVPTKNGTWTDPPTIQDPFAVSLVCCMTEADVNESRPVVYILEVSLTQPSTRCGHGLRCVVRR